MEEADFRRELLEKSERREAIRRTTWSVTKFIGWMSLFVAYVMAARTWPDIVSTISLLAFLGVLAGGFIWTIYNHHLDGIRRG